MRTSYSSLLRRMPMYQPQLNLTDFRSFAPGAGLKYCTPPRPRPPPPAPSAPFGPAPRAPWAGAAGAAPACAKTQDGALIIRAAAIATHVHHILFREAIAISPVL